MKVIGIDPGPTESAWVFWDGGRVQGFGKVPSEDVLELLGTMNAAEANLLVAIEMVQSFGMAVGAEVFETVFWVGRYAQRSLTLGMPTRRAYRGDVKMHLCNSMRAKDPNIRQALIDRIGAPGTKKAPGPTYGISGDCWAALAVAVTATDIWDRLRP